MYNYTYDSGNLLDGWWHCAARWRCKITGTHRRRAAPVHRSLAARAHDPASANGASFRGRNWRPSLTNIQRTYNYNVLLYYTELSEPKELMAVGDRFHTRLGPTLDSTRVAGAEGPAEMEPTPWLCSFPSDRGPRPVVSTAKPVAANEGRERNESLFCKVSTAKARQRRFSHTDKRQPPPLLPGNGLCVCLSLPVSLERSAEQ